MAEKVDQYEVVHLLLLDRAYNLCRILELWKYPYLEIKNGIRIINSASTK
jgi:hypothetical protein